MADSVFSFAGVGVRRGERWTLQDVSAEVPASGVTALVGPSGAGKTTLLRLCNRLDVPDAGQVRFRGRDVLALDPLRLRRQAGMVFQRPALFGGTVRDNLHVARPGADDASLAEALRRVALDPAFLDQEAARLSGGEAQRACLARTLVTEPEVLLLDEPTSALDAGPRLAFEQLIGRLATAGMPVLWVTHDMEQMRRVAGQVIVLIAGRMRFAGPLADLDRHPDVLAVLAGHHADESAGERSAS